MRRLGWQLGQRNIAVFAGLLLAGALAAEASPFVWTKGSGMVLVSASRWNFDQFLDGSGEEVDLPGDIDQTSIQLGFEHGLTDSLTLSLALPWVSSERSFDLAEVGFETNDGVGDARIGLRWRMNSLASRTAITLLVGAKWPGDYEKDLINAPGDGNFDAEVGLSVGQQRDRGSWSLEGGYRMRSGEPSNEIVLRGDGSVALGARAQLFGTLEWVNASDGLDLEEGVAPPADFLFSQLEEDVTRLTAGFVVSFTDRVAGFVTAARSLEGSNTALGEEFGLGIVVNY